MHKEAQPACEQDHHRGDSATPPSPQHVGLIGSMLIIFSFTSKLDYLLLVLPAFLLSVLAGLLPAYMTILVGQAFQLFADYTITTTGAPSSAAITAQAKDTLRHEIGLVAIKLICLACATFLLSLITHTLWAINGSKICEKIQASVYDSVSRRDLAWFENGMKTRYQFLGEQPDNSDSSHPAQAHHSLTTQTPAGLMARFARWASFYFSIIFPSAISSSSLTSFFFFTLCWPSMLQANRRHPGRNLWSHGDDHTVQRHPACQHHPCFHQVL